MDTGREIAEALRAEWRMIASVSLRPREAGDGYEASLWLDAVVVWGSLEQQGYPRTPAAATRIENRRHAAIDHCVQKVNERLPVEERIKSFAVVGLADGNGKVVSRDSLANPEALDYFVGLAGSSDRGSRNRRMPRQSP